MTDTLGSLEGDVDRFVVLVPYIGAVDDGDDDTTIEAMIEAAEAVFRAEIDQQPSVTV